MGPTAIQVESSSNPMDPLDIVIINDNAHVNGGAGRIGLSGGLALAKHGHQVTVFSAVGPVMPELLAEKNIKVICTQQYEILHDPNRLRAMIQGIWNFQAKQKMEQLLKSLDPKRTIIHIHTWSKALSSSVVQIALQKNFKVVITLHDYLIACPTGTLFNHPKQEICTLTPMGMECIRENCDTRNYGHKVWRVSRQFVQDKYGMFPRELKHFITYSQLSRSVLEPFIPKDATIHTVESPIPIEQRPPISVLNNTAFTFLGRLVKEKGASLLAEAAHRLQVEATFVGDGDCREAILQLNPHAKITGWIQPKDTVHYLQQARALVLPSLWYEGQPLVVAEATARGIPAIVPDTCAAREKVVDGVTGLWFKGGSVEDLTQKMAILQDPQVAACMGLAAYEHYWADPLTPERHVENLERVYAQMLQD
jgi:glycosyltransferase involved in cell wall biosynthesis